MEDTSASPANDEYIDFAWLDMTGDEYAAFQLVESVSLTERSTSNVEA